MLVVVPKIECTQVYTSFHLFFTHHDVKFLFVNWSVAFMNDVETKVALKLSLYNKFKTI